jgi:hypothetical protein
VAITAVDVLDTVAPLPAPGPAPATGAVVEPAADGATAPFLHRAPAAVATLAAVGLLEAVAIVAAALAGLGDLVATAHRPSAAVLALAVLALAVWVVVCAAGGATVLDATGSRLYTATAAVELVAVGILLLGSAVVTLPTGLTGGIPVPIIALLAVVVPAGKLLLAGSPSTEQWLAQGPRPRERRIDPVAAHRGLCVGTLAVIGVVLGAVALLGPASPAPHAHAPSSAASVRN